jgi:hypothetical protein
MHILGARFKRDEPAFAALRELRARYDLREDDAAVWPLGTTQYDRPASDLILAGRFRPEVLDDVKALVEALGGTVVFDRAEWPPHPSGPSRTD